MTDIVTAVYELMGKFADPNLDHEGVREKVDRIFQVWIFFLSYYSFNLQSIIITQYYGIVTHAWSILQSTAWPIYYGMYVHTCQLTIHLSNRIAPACCDDWKIDQLLDDLSSQSVTMDEKLFPQALTSLLVRFDEGKRRVLVKHTQSTRTVQEEAFLFTDCHIVSREWQCQPWRTRMYVRTYLYVFPRRRVKE